MEHLEHQPPPRRGLLARLFGSIGGGLSSNSRKGRAVFFVLLIAIVGALVFAGYNAYGAFSLNVANSKFVHPNTSCSTSNCHGRPSVSGKMYVAVDGVEVPDEVVIEKDAGDYLEIDFHFTGLNGDVKRFSGVGVSVEVPGDSNWRLSWGSLQRPGSWSETGDEPKLWNSNWDRSANGSSPLRVRWASAADKQNVYYADYSASKWSVPEYPVSADDRGVDSEGDLDGLAGHMGMDFVLNVPAEAKAGSYTVVLSAVGHDPDGKRTNISRKITVQVSEELPYAFAVERGRSVYLRACLSCHGEKGDRGAGVKIGSREIFERWDPGGLARVILEGRRQMRPQAQEKGGTLTEQDAKAVVKYLMSLAGVPPSSIKVQGTHEFSQGESFGAVLNRLGITDTLTPRDHVGALPPSAGGQAPSTRLSVKPSGPPGVPHETATLKECLTCHGPAGLEPVSKTHDRRLESTCLECHKSDLPKTGVPKIAHKLERREWCDSCHLIDAGPRPMTLSHATRTVESCLVCHSGPPFAPHKIEEVQTNCKECHAKLPASHQKRADDTCTSCHSGPVTLPEEVAGWSTRPRARQPQPPVELIPSSGPPVPPVAGAKGVAHRAEDHEMCLSCHGPESGFKSVSATHAGRGEETCTSCHARPPKAGHGIKEGATGSSCGFCHSGMPNHRDRPSNCLLCHASGESATIAPSATSSAAQQSSGSPAAPSSPAPAAADTPVLSDVPGGADIRVPDLTKESGYYYVFDAKEGPLSASWQIAGSSPMRLALYAGVPFGPGSGFAALPAQIPIAQSIVASGASAAIIPFQAGEGQYTVFFYNAGLSTVTTSSASVSYAK